MGVFVNCVLLVLGTVALVMGISFYLRNIKYEKETSIIILMYGLSSAVWCFCYGLIGILPRVEWCPYIRVLGIFSVDTFIMTEVFLGCKLTAANKRRTVAVKTVMFILTIVDFLLFSQTGVDRFVRENEWTTWYINPDYQYVRSYHSLYVALTFVVLLSLAAIWVAKGTLKREWRFINLLYLANFIFFFCSIPDTFLPMLGKPALSTSGIGAALCTMVVWYGATQLNFFDIRMGNIADRFLNFIDAGIVIFDTDCRVAIMNDYCRGLLKKRNKEPSDETIQFVFDNNNLSKELAFEIAKENIWTARLCDMDHTHYYSVRLNALKDDYNVPFCYMCVFVDVTEEMALIDKVEYASKAKTDFLAQMSHEIRTPINTVLGMNEMILRKSASEEILEYAENINSSGKILLSLINSILDFSKIEDGSMELVPVEYDSVSVLSNVVKAISLQAAEKGLNFTVDVDETLPTKMFGDDVRITQIITNLLTNAVKYTQEGDVTLTVKTQGKTEDRQRIYVGVSDTGIGIKKEDLDRLSVSFERLDEVKNHNIEGTGLGISIVTRLLHMMDSELKIESEYGSGSCFSFVVEQLIVDETPIGDFNKSMDFGAGFVERKDTIIAPDARILVVDDNDMNLKVANKLLSLCGVVPELVSSGKEALESVKHNTYDIILLDHMMPEMDGVETLHRLKNENLIPKETAVVVITANAIAGAKEEYLAEGFSDYLAKPIELSDLEKVLRTYLGSDRVFVQKDSSVSKEPEENNPFPRIEGINWESAFRHMPDKEMLYEVIETFCTSSDSDLIELQRYYEKTINNSSNENVSAYRIKVHAMKNSAATVGAAALSEEARALEYAARENDIAFIKEHQNEFVKNYRTMAETIFSKMFRGEIPDKKMMENDALYRNLFLLKTAMEDFDTMTLNQLSALLSQYEFSDIKISREVERLQESIRNFNREEFKKTIAKLEDMLS